MLKKEPVYAISRVRDTEPKLLNANHAESHGKAPVEMKMNANNLNVTLRFQENPNVHIHDPILQVLISSYKERVVSK